MKALSKYLLIVITLLHSGCEDTIDLSLKTEDTDLLVVEGIVTNQNINHLIKLTRPHQQINGIPLPATGATVIVGEGEFINDEVVLNDTIPSIEFPSGSGEYYTEAFRAVFGKVYVLLIEYQGNSYFAFDSSTPAEPLPEISLQRATEDPPFYRINLQGSGSEANFVNHLVNWENTDFCESGVTCLGKVVFYDLKTVDVHEIFKPDKTDFTFPVNSVIIRTKYSVNERYRTFLRSVLSETEWRGGIFDIQRANALTNLSEGAIGFFAVSTVVSDTTIVTQD